MKKIFSICLIFLSYLSLAAQSVPDYDEIYKKAQTLHKKIYKPSTDTTQWYSYTANFDLYDNLYVFNNIPIEYLNETKLTGAFIDIFDSNDIMIFGEDHRNPVPFEKVVVNIIVYNAYLDILKVPNAKEKKIKSVVVEAGRDFWTPYFEANKARIRNPNDDGFCDDIAKEHVKKASSIQAILLRSICRLHVNNVQVIHGDINRSVDFCGECGEKANYLDGSKVSAASDRGMFIRDIYTVEVAEKAYKKYGKTVILSGADHLCISKSSYLGLRDVLRYKIPDARISSALAIGGKYYFDKRVVFGGCKCDSVAGDDVTSGNVIIALATTYGTVQTYVLPIEAGDDGYKPVDYLIRLSDNMPSSADFIPRNIDENGDPY
ncbi:hypothetical protein Dip518_001589 [Parelusimicrobium proximum]|uniref:hypothetical protein n=1 Tax=Parelusimicrobium proximum TaxID=3228953 RepID=UPI003D186A6B